MTQKSISQGALKNNFELSIYGKNFQRNFKNREPIFLKSLIKDKYLALRNEATSVLLDFFWIYIIEAISIIPYSIVKLIIVWWIDDFTFDLIMMLELIAIFSPFLRPLYSFFFLLQGWLGNFNDFLMVSRETIKLQNVDMIPHTLQKSVAHSFGLSKIDQYKRPFQVLKFSVTSMTA